MEYKLFVRYVDNKKIKQILVWLGVITTNYLYNINFSIWIRCYRFRCFFSKLRFLIRDRYLFIFERTLSIYMVNFIIRTCIEVNSRKWNSIKAYWINCVTFFNKKDSCANSQVHKRFVDFLPEVRVLDDFKDIICHLI